MPELVNTMMLNSVLAYLEHVKGVPKDWAPPEIAAAMANNPRVVARSLQNLLFDQVMAEFGPETLENAASVLTANRGSPLVFAMINVNTPRQAMEKFARLKKYLHSLAQMDILADDARSITVRHYFKSGTPHPGEHRYTFGAARLILQEIGGRDVVGSLEDPGPGRSSSPGRGKPGGEEIWRFSWSAFTPAFNPMEGLDEVLTAKLPNLSEAGTHAEQVRTIVSGNLSERWNLERVAAQLGISPRSLQRYLQREGTQFSGILADCRVEKGTQLLRQTQSSVTEIGFFLGYADTPHFSRDFKARTGSTPSEIRIQAQPG